jgi:CubicO group peptidase (beta-lactamase class C family)
MDSKELAKLVDFGTTLSLDSLLVVRHGKIVAEAYYAPYAAGIPHEKYSATKAVISTLMSIASKDGLLDSPSHRVLDFFDRPSIANLDDSKKAITVQNLLDMTSGIEWRMPDSMFEMERSPDWVKFVLDRPMSSAPGDVFNYSNGNAHLLSAIITKITGMSALEYGKAKLFGPLGINDLTWGHDPQGISNGGQGLYLQPRDMAKIGYLYLRNGAWEGKQLLPSDWIDKVTHAKVDPHAPGEPEFRYSNFFWVLPDEHVYMASGYHGQVIMVFPDLDVVAVTTGRDNYPLSKLAGDISSSVKSDTALPPDAASANLLANKILDGSSEKATGVGGTPGMAAIISGKVYRFPPNAINVKSLSLILTDPQPHYDMETYRRDTTKSGPRFTGPIGLDGLYRKGELTDYGFDRSNWRFPSGQRRQGDLARRPYVCDRRADPRPRETSRAMDSNVRRGEAQRPPQAWRRRRKFYRQRDGRISIPSFRRTEHDVRRGCGRPQPANREWTASSCCVKFRARLLTLAGAAIVAMVIVLALGH